MTERISNDALETEKIEFQKSAPCCPNTLIGAVLAGALFAMTGLVPSGAVGFKEASPETIQKIYNNWIERYMVADFPDGSSVLVRHTHSDKCRKDGFCSFDEKEECLTLKEPAVGREYPAIVSIRLVSDADGTANDKVSWAGSPSGGISDPGENLWIVKVVDVKPWKRTGARNMPDVGLVLVDFGRSPVDELYFDRTLEVPLIKTGTRTMVVARLVELGYDVKGEKTFPSYRTVRKPSQPRIQGRRPSPDDFQAWIEAGNEETCTEEFQETCPKCKHRGMWTETRDGKHVVVKCDDCNGSGTVWKSRTTTIKGP